MKRLERLLITRTEGKHVARVQYKLGLAYELGRGVISDDAKAAQLYEAAARGGHVKAMFAYAISLDEGRGLVRDPSICQSAPLLVARAMINAFLRRHCDECG